MSRFSFLLSHSASIKAPDPKRELGLYDPATIRDLLNRVMKRRLSDDLESLCQKARLAGDLRTARGLLAVLADLVQREDKRFARDRRVSDGMIERLTAELNDAEAR
jgi:hypothetical protein